MCLQADHDHDIATTDLRTTTMGHQADHRVTRFGISSGDRNLDWMHLRKRKRHEKKKLKRKNFETMCMTPCRSQLALYWSELVLDQTNLLPPRQHLRQIPSRIVASLVLSYRLQLGPFGGFAGMTQMTASVRLFNNPIDHDPGEAHDYNPTRTKLSAWSWIPLAVADYTE